MSCKFKDFTKGDGIHPCCYVINGECQFLNESWDALCHILNAYKNLPGPTPTIKYVIFKSINGNEYKFTAEELNGKLSYKNRSNEIKAPFNKYDELLDIKNLSEIDDLTNTITIVERYSFKECSNLRSINIKNLKTINGYCFTSTKLTGVVDLQNVENINDNLNFYFCKQIEKVIFGNIKTISNATFTGCSALKELDMRNVKQVPSLISTAVFPKNSNKIKVYIPNAMKENFENNEKWAFSISDNRIELIGV